MASPRSDPGVPTFCALCVSRCGARASVEQGRLVALRPDPSHPTGQALCIKGKTAPELVHHPERLLHPLRRTRPKGDPDPGWERIGWDEALDATAEALSRIARESGPESVVFSSASPSTTAMSDSLDWVQRLQRSFGSPNLVVSMELCGWGRYLASTYTWGAAVPGAYMPDIEHAGCILFWGYNPSVARLSHATATAAALRRGARLVVVDPRRVGFAGRADQWLQVRPGTDGALALALAHVMVERGWFDRDFVRRWTNGPLLVRSDDGRLLRERDLDPAGRVDRYVAWDGESGQPVVYDPERDWEEGASARLDLGGWKEIATPAGPLACTPAFQLVADLCRRYAPARTQGVTGVTAADVEEAARLLWEERPVAFYAWSGIEQHSNATQTVRAIGQLYALTGSFDARGGNVLFPSVRVNRIDGEDLLPSEQRAKALGLPERPLGPARWDVATTDDLYTGALEGRPYRVRGLVGFGANLLIAQADGRRGKKALEALDFYVHADLFMNPTAETADIVLPVASPFETEALRPGFEVSAEAARLLQLRHPLVTPRGEARGDARIVFDLATRLGLGHHFWEGDLDAALRYRLEPTGISLERLRAEPQGVSVGGETRHRKYAERVNGRARGFGTATRLVELYSEVFLEHGYPPLPEFEEPAMSPRSNPHLARQFPLVLTCAKSTWFCESQHRQLPGLRRRSPDPRVELHPEAARERGIADGDWVRIETPQGSVRARASLNEGLAPDVVCGEHGWWQACEEIGAPGYDPFSPEGANLNLLIGQQSSDLIGGSVPHRAYLCNVARVP